MLLLGMTETSEEVPHLFARDLAVPPSRVAGLGFLRLGVWGLGFGVWGLGFRVWGLGFFFHLVHFSICGLGFRVLGFGVYSRVYSRVWGLGFGVWGFGFRAYEPGLLVRNAPHLREVPWSLNMVP